MKQISSLLIIASLALATGCPEKSEDNQKITYGLPAQTAIARTTGFAITRTHLRLQRIDLGQLQTQSSS
jgi:hypothetical protein